jgi:hypothetical protein
MHGPCLHDFMSRVCEKMEVITADGRRAGHVKSRTADQIFLSESDEPILKEWIRRVARDVYISKRWRELAH